MEARLGHGRIPRADLVLAVVLLALGELEVVLGEATTAGVLVVAICTVPLALRRRVPLAAAAGVFAAPLLGHALDNALEPMFSLFAAAIIAQYSVAAYASTATAIVGGLIAFAGPAYAVTQSPTGDGEVAASAVLLAVPWIAGQVARRLRLDVQELSALAALLERQREANARLAVAEERAARRGSSIGQRDGDDPRRRGRSGPAGVAGRGAPVAEHRADAGTGRGRGAAAHAPHPGDAPLAPEITHRLLDRFAKRPLRGMATPPELHELTPRELEVLRLIADGQSNAEIAAALVLSEATIKPHVNHILTKLRLRDRVQAVALAYRSGLMDAPSPERPG